MCLCVIERVYLCERESVFVCEEERERERVTVGGRAACICTISYHFLIITNEILEELFLSNT